MTIMMNVTLMDCTGSGRADDLEAEYANALTEYFGSRKSANKAHQAYEEVWSQLGEWPCDHATQEQAHKITRWLIADNKATEQAFRACQWLDIPESAYFAVSFWIL